MQPSSESGHGELKTGGGRGAGPSWVDSRGPPRPIIQPETVSYKRSAPPPTPGPRVAPLLEPPPPPVEQRGRGRGRGRPGKLSSSGSSVHAATHRATPTPAAGPRGMRGGRPDVSAEGRPAGVGRRRATAPRRPRPALDPCTSGATGRPSHLGTAPQRAAHDGRDGPTPRVSPTPRGPPRRTSRRPNPTQAPPFGNGW